MCASAVSCLYHQLADDQLIIGLSLPLNRDSTILPTLHGVDTEYLNPEPQPRDSADLFLFCSPHAYARGILSFAASDLRNADQGL